LFIRGSLSSALAVAVVGTREPSEPARQYAHTLAYRLAKRGVVVWSGGALGIDAAAHRGALDAGGVTVAVMGTGLDHCYPREHAELYEQIVAAGGALVSPFARSQQGRHYTFTQRNGVLAALTRATVVVQAPMQSGARSTARFARHLGRPLFVVPAWPWDQDGAGNVLELAIGARPLANEDALFEALNVRSPASRGQRTSRARPIEEAPALARVAPEFDSPHAAAVFRATCPSPRHFDDLCSETRLGAPLVQQALLTLTLQAVLVEDPAGWYRRSSR